MECMNKQNLISVELKYTARHIFLKNLTSTKVVRNLKRNILAMCNSQNCSNLTKDEDEFDEEVESGFAAETDVYLIVLGFFIVVINSLVLVKVAKRRNLRAVSANVILASLAFSDLLTGILGIPLLLTCNILRHATVCYTENLMLRFTSVSTVLHLLAATVDRYLSIMHALRYHTLVTRRRVYAVIGCIWSTAAFMSLIQTAWLTPDNMGIHDDPSQYIITIEIRYDIFCLVAFVGVPVCFMAFTYSRIVIVVVKQRRNIQRNSVTGWQETQKKTKREWKAVTIFAVMLLVYVVCWLPYFILRLQQNIGSSFFELSIVLEYVLLYLRFTTSLFNPCLYIFGKQDFRKSLRRKGKSHRTSTFSDATRKSTLKITKI